jgi:2-iminobutanoate/2-iminopropanoate deaminase
MPDVQKIQTDDAPAAIGPYSQAIVANGFVFTAGQVAFDPATKEIIAGGIVEQTGRVIANLRAILQAAGHFTEPYPARSTVQVARLPRDVAVEIEAVAVLLERNS